MSTSASTRMAHGTSSRRAVSFRNSSRYRISYIEQPFNALLPQRFYPPGSPPPYHSTGFQREYYFRKLEQLRQHTRIPFSCHWWTPPIVQPEGAHQRSDSWDFDWAMIDRYDPVDIAVPDIGLGVFGLWRLLQMARFMGLHLTIHSNFELGLQSRFRGMMYQRARLLSRDRRALSRHDAAALHGDGHRVQSRERRRAGRRQAADQRRIPAARKRPGARAQARSRAARPLRLYRGADPAASHLFEGRFTTTTGSTGRGAGQCRAGTRIRASSGSRGRPIPMTSQGFSGSTAGRMSMSS